MATMMAGCVAPPPRPTTYYENRPTAYSTTAIAAATTIASETAAQCGRITDVERVYAHDRARAAAER